jgi:hypothetical protein
VEVVTRNRYALFLSSSLAGQSMRSRIRLPVGSFRATWIKAPLLLMFNVLPSPSTPEIAFLELRQIQRRFQHFVRRPAVGRPAG